MKLKTKDFHILKKSANVPRLLYERYNKMLQFAIGFVFCGIVSAFLYVNTSLLVTVLSGFIAVAFFLMATYYKYLIEINGYTQITGTVTFIKQVFTTPKISIRDASIHRPSYYHIRTDNGEIYKIPAIRTADELPMGSTVAVYTSTTPSIFKHNGILTISPVWCYELLDEEIAYDET